MPAAAVIPAPIVYIKVAAVKKLVVGFRNAAVKVRLNGVARRPLPYFGSVACVLARACSVRSQSFTLKKLECSKQA